MSAKRPFPDGSTEKLKAAMKKARTKDEYRRVLCLWLRKALGLNAEQVATALTWSVAHVRFVQARYLRMGETAFELAGRGGRRRELLKVHDERKLLRRLREEAWPNSVLEFRAVHQAVEQAAGRPVDPTVVSRILARHGWGRRADVTVGTSKVPPGVSLYTPSPHRTGVWYMLRDDTEEWKAIDRRLQGRKDAVEKL